MVRAALAIGKSIILIVTITRRDGAVAPRAKRRQDGAMQRDDTPIGRLLGRREAVALLGAAGMTLLAGRAAGQMVPVCVVRPQQTEGPFFVEEALDRSDIRADPGSGTVKAGVPLQITFNVSQLAGSTCTRLAGARVDVWHCDALGEYSGTGGAAGQKFLRGYQLTDQAGVARFTTIYPGGYQGRAVHVHFKVRTKPAASPGAEFTSQLYFDDAVTDRVHRQRPYADLGQRRTRNEADGPFRSGGRQLLLPVTESAGAYAGTFVLALTSARTG
jgi:protocatechuate 3,4-dioxygenase beta subunit